MDASDVMEALEQFVGEAFGHEDPDIEQSAILQLMVAAECADIFMERSEQYREAWRKHGALANLIKASMKMDRLMEVWWHSDMTQAQVEKMKPEEKRKLLDDAFDCINYLTFFVRLVGEGTLR